MQFTVYFESPFWIGVLEEEHEGVLYAARHVFGPEPSNETVYQFILHNLNDLRACMTSGVPVDESRRRRKNPKRMQREIRREMERVGTSTKAHEAMRQQIEHNKRASRTQSKTEHEAERKRKHEIKAQKARKKHRGR